MSQEYAVLICTRKRSKMFWKTLLRLRDRFSVPFRYVVAGLSACDLKDYRREQKMMSLEGLSGTEDINWVKTRRFGIGSARECVRKAALKLFKETKKFLWIDDKTNVKKDLMRGLALLDRKNFGIVCGTSSLIRFFTKPKDKQKLWGCTLMWVRREVLERCHFSEIRCYEDKLFMLKAIKEGWLIVNDYKMDYDGPRHLVGGTSSHKGLDKRHVEYAKRVIRRDAGLLIKKMTLREKSKRDRIYALMFKYDDRVTESIISVTV